MLPYNHEEADTRICLHVADAVHKGATNVIVSTVDTDVVVILVGTFCQLKKMRPGVQIWVAFGNGKHYKRYHINSICEQLGEDKCVALPFFHAFTGCDTTSQFNGKWKKSCWEAWDAFPLITKRFAFPMTIPFEQLTTESPFFQLIEAFTCVLYDNSTTCEEVNDLRKDLFPRKVQRMQCLPPTQAALLQHVNSSMLQSSIWLRSFETHQNVPCPEVFGWTKRVTKWKPQWTLLDEAATSCRQLINADAKLRLFAQRDVSARALDITCGINGQMRLFADDALLYYPVRIIADGASLQHDLHTLHRWSKSWKMEFNGKKCHVMHVIRNRNITSCSYILGQDKLTPVSHHPYLGVDG